MTRQTTAILAAALLLVACDGETEPATGEDTCGASGYASLVGTNIAAVTLPADLDDRVIGPDTMVTMDFRPTRINFMVDAEGVITEVRCG